MSADVIQFPRTLPTDGGRARILRRRDNFKFVTPSTPYAPSSEDELLMDHADTVLSIEALYCAPECDPA